MKYLDTRDLNERLEELEAERGDLQTEIEEARDALETADTPEDRAQARQDLEAAEKALLTWKDENEEELTELVSLRDEFDHRIWRDGETLIPESEFTDYCEDLLKDCGELPQNIPGYIVIDWEATAENLKADYSEAEYQGTTYLFRSC